MPTATAPRELTTTQHILKTEHQQVFTAEHMGGPVWALVSANANGTLVINDDYGIAWYPGQTWNEDGSEPTVTADFDVNYDDETDEYNVAEFAAWAAKLMSAPDATEADTDRDARAKREGEAAGAAAYTAYGDLNHYTMTDLGVAAAQATFSERGSSRAIYSMAFVFGYNTAKEN